LYHNDLEAFRSTWERIYQKVHDMRERITDLRSEFAGLSKEWGQVQSKSAYKKDPNETEEEFDERIEDEWREQVITLENLASPLQKIDLELSKLESIQLPNFVTNQRKEVRARS